MKAASWTLAAFKVMVFASELSISLRAEFGDLTLVNRLTNRRIGTSTRNRKRKLA